MTSMNRIAQEIGVHRSTVMRRIRRGVDPYEGGVRIAVPKPFARSVPVGADEIRNAVAAGMGNSEMARELGVSTTTIYRRAAKMGIDVKRGQILHVKTIRRNVQDMNAREAVAYLLEVIEQLVGQDEPIDRMVGDVRLSPQQAVIFAMLGKHMGQPVSREVMLSVIQSGQRDAGSTLKVVDVLICGMRKRLRDQYRIDTIWGFGYRMEKIG